ncbi:hypothetical protein IU470_18785 [Nocardia abscessus]|uniref:Uncharacterized protein n=1 Tax=Nocardia abscessus TaxID=120957 RepID=A0ABS0CFF6_9NOCA|nr:hypothetical protein [Nocardia abscessus]MBF6227143.1 hypothetical protein [Nocardia abscessus]
MQETEAQQLATTEATPSDAELSIAINTIMETIKDGNPVHEHDAVKAVCLALGVPASAGGVLNINDAASVKASPIVQYAKARHATRLAIAKLGAQGLIVPLTTPTERGGVENIEFYSGSSMFNRTGRIEIPVGVMLIPTTFQLTPGLAAAGNVALLTVEGWKSELAPLLNDRLLRQLDEALSASRRGNHLSCATLLGAVAEGAWYAVGEELRSRDGALATALDNDRTATVQTKVSDLLAALPREKNSMAGVLAFATQLRMVRNYGIHTTAHDDVAAEEYFTETGNYVLILQTYSHLVKLLATVRKLDPTLFP